MGTAERMQPRIGANPTNTPHRWLEFAGWQQYGVEIEDAPEGYYEPYYWGDKGQYLGPDQDGVEPIYWVAKMTIVMTTWLPLPRAAAQLGIHKRTLLRWHQMGKLPADALMQTPTGRWLVNPQKVPGLG
jgi:hypothetical protein